MIRVLILCTLVQSAVFTSINRSNNRKHEKDVAKKAFYHKFLYPDGSFENEKSRYYDSSYDEPPFSRATRRTRVLKWLKNILITTAKPHYFSFEDRTRENYEESNMTAVLIKLIRALDSLNYNLKCNNKNDYLTFRFPKRQKRDSYNDVKKNSTQLDHIHNENDTFKSDLKLERSGDSTSTSDYNSSNNVKNERAISDPTELLANDNDASIQDFNTNRRFIFTPKPRPGMKEQLLDYLENMFINLEHKIHTLTKLKITLSEDNGYRIGYIIANIDILQIQLQKLKREMDENKRFWNEYKFNEFLNKLKVANGVVLNLLNILMSYLL